MSQDKGLIIDAWTALSFKRVLGVRGQPGTDWQQPTWVGSHARRLSAYKMLKSYVENAGREYLADASEATKADHREYGDASLLTDTIRGAVIGKNFEVYAEGADEVNEEGNPANVEAFALQEWHREWADKERYRIKVVETERNAHELGDGVYILGWNPDAGRVRLRVIDPGFYFPVLDDGPEDEYPKKVHMAWELVDERNPGRVQVRRITWELRDVDPYAVPWEDRPATKQCFLSDGTWTLQTGGKQTVDDLTGSSVTWTEDADGPIVNRPLGIDFIPVVHIPNTPALLNHFGKSSISSVLQILDDLANADTDTSKASATTGFPPVALSGVALDTDPEYGPGVVWQLGQDGKLSVVDTSRSLDALLKGRDSLLDRLSVNSRTPAALLGRVKPSEVPSGLAMSLSFGPLDQMVEENRLVREEKYQLLHKFVHRIAVANKQEGVPTTFNVVVGVRPGPFLPQDEDAAINRARLAMGQSGGPVASWETIVQILVDGGVPIEDIAAEVERMQHRDFTGAAALMDVTNDVDEVSGYLGRNVEEPEPPVLPPGPPGVPPTEPGAPPAPAPAEEE